MKPVTNFGKDKGKAMTVIRSLCILKSSQLSWRAMLADTLLDLGYKSSRVYMDVWMNNETYPRTGK